MYYLGKYLNLSPEVEGAKMFAILEKSDFFLGIIPLGFSDSVINIK